METILLSAGIACLIAAVIGGGLNAFGIEIRLLESLTRQLLLGALGAILVVISFATSAPPNPPDGKSSPTPKPMGTDPSSPRVSPPRTDGPLHLSVNNNPRVVVAGGQTTILVRVTDQAGNAVADARVRVSAGGGYFVATGVTTVYGLTDAQGLYRTNWHTYEARAYTGNMSYALRIDVSKEGFAKGERELTVPVSLQ